LPRCLSLTYYNEDADGVYGNADNTDDPVNVSVGSPGKQKQSDRNYNRRDESRDQAVFLCSHAVGSDRWVDSDVEVKHIDGNRDEQGDHDGKEGQPKFSDVEAVKVYIHERECLKE